MLTWYGSCMYTNDSPSTPVCFPVSKVIRYRATSFGSIAGEDAMLRELQNGPITCAIAANVDFTTNYTRGVYMDHTNFTDLDHDVEIVGYGVDAATGLKFWHARNSWGTYVP